MTPDEQRAMERLQRTVDRKDAQMAELQEALEKVTAERDAWIANYMTVADAVAAESNSPQQLASIARSARAELSRLRDENARLTADLELERGEHVSDRNRFQNVPVNLHAIARDEDCDPRSSIGMATSAVRQLRKDRDAAIAARAELIMAGNLLRQQLLDWSPWINFGATRPGAGLCICVDREADDFDIETVQDPAKHCETCLAFRTALNSWADALASSRDGKEGGNG